MMKHRLPLRLLCLAAAAVLSLGGCRKPPAGEQAVEFVLGTFCSITLYEGARAEVFSRIFTRLRRIEAVMSANQGGTALDRVSQNAGVEPVPVPADLFEVLESARRYAELSGGSFDPTIGPLVKLWDIGFTAPRIPSPAEIQECLALVNWRDLILDREAGTAFLARPGMALDLGAVAKGYAADEAVRIIAEAGLKRAIVNLGGNIFAYGEKTGPGQPGLPWRIGVQDPLEGRGGYLGILEVRNTSIVTSGVYERFFEEDGQRYHHILSTETGYPVDNGLLSVTIAADRSIDADALSTVVFTLGYERGLELIESVPRAGAVFVFGDRTVRLSSRLRSLFSLNNPAYRIE